MLNRVSITPLLLAFMAGSVSGQEPGQRLSQDSRIVVAFDSITRADTLPKTMLAAQDFYGGEWTPCHGLATVLPLPGKFKAFTRITVGNDEQIAIVLTRSENETTAILPAQSPAMPEKSSDILIDFASDTVTVSAREELRLLAVGDRFWTFDYEGALRQGRIIRPSGRLVVLIADESTRTVVSEITFQFNEEATIGWDIAENRPEWRGFSVRTREK
jgi:hypothetical protein